MYHTVQWNVVLDYEKKHNPDRISGRTAIERKYSLIEIAEYCHEMLTNRFATKRQFLENTNSGLHIPISQQTFRRIPIIWSAMKSQMLICSHKKACLPWAKFHKNWTAEDWNWVMRVEETLFFLYSNHARHRMHCRSTVLKVWHKRQVGLWRSGYVLCYLNCDLFSKSIKH